MSTWSLGERCVTTLWKKTNKKVSDPQGLLEGCSLILGIFGNGCVGASAFTTPHFFSACWIPVLISRLRKLSPDLHQVFRVGFYQRLCGEQTQVCREHTDKANSSKLTVIINTTAHVKQSIYPVWERLPGLWWQWLDWRGLYRTDEVGGRKHPFCSQAGQKNK